MPDKFTFYGSISSGTMRSEDLIPAFEAVLKQLNPNFPDPEPSDERDTDSEEYLNEGLFEELNKLAPAGYYFGSHPGDGSDYGFWLQDDAQRE